MNYITEINRFYDWLETNQVPKSAIALWYAIMHIGNKTGWEPQFTVAISTIESKTGFKRSELFEARNILTQKGRIIWKQRGGNLSAEYEIIPFCVHNTDAKAYAKAYAVPDAKAYTNPTQKHTINKLNNTKLKETKHSFPGDESPVPKKEIIKTLYWEKLVDTWFVFYEKSYSIKPSFNAAAGKNLKGIVDRLEKLTKLKGYEWNEDHSVVCLNHFLTKAKTDNWLNQNFLLSNLNSQFDKIVNPKNDGTPKNGKEPTGANVDPGAAFETIDRMFAKNAN